MKELNVFVDGGSRGNPGPAAIGIYMVDDRGKVFFKLGKTIGLATNNEAEYKAVIEALDYLITIKKQLKETLKINFYMDSRLIYSQISGLFKVKDSRMRNLLFSVREKEARLGLGIFYHNIPREKNTEADALLNIALNKEH